MACAEQQTTEWFKARIGCLTASRAAAVLKRGRDGKPLKAYYELLDEIVTERLTGSAVEHFCNDAMIWGIEHEDEARSRYENVTGNLVTEVGLVMHPTIQFLGASPDGLVGDDGLVEIKCPSMLTHLRRIRCKEVPDEYKPQMLIQLLCTGRKWVDYVDYDPRFPQENLQFFTVRYEPTEAELQDAADKCKGFLIEVESTIQTIMEM